MYFIVLWIYYVFFFFLCILLVDDFCCLRSSFRSISSWINAIQSKKRTKLLIYRRKWKIHFAICFVHKMEKISLFGLTFGRKRSRDSVTWGPICANLVSKYPQDFKEKSHEATRLKARPFCLRGKLCVGGGGASELVLVKACTGINLHRSYSSHHFRIQSLCNLRDWITNLRAQRYYIKARSDFYWCVQYGKYSYIHFYGWNLLVNVTCRKSQIIRNKSSKMHRLRHNASLGTWFFPTVDHHCGIQLHTRFHRTCKRLPLLFILYIYFENNFYLE